MSAQYKKVKRVAFIVMPLFLAAITLLLAFVTATSAGAEYIDMLGMVMNYKTTTVDPDEPPSIYDPTQQVPPEKPDDNTRPDISVPDTSDEPSWLYGIDYIYRSDVKYPRRGERYGEVIFNSLDNYSVRLYFDDSLSLLKWGAGQYYGSFPPGFGRTILIGGHTVSRFNSLIELQPGDIVTIRTSYSDYQYRMTHSVITEYDDPTAYDLGADYENLVLYNCYPPNSFGLTTRRLFVYFEKISGPAVIPDE